MAIKRKVKDTSFKGIDLNESVVNGLYNVCLATDKTIRTVPAQIFQMELAGKDSTLVRFEKQKIQSNTQSISYLLGQLKGVHERNRLMAFEFGTILYIGKKWTINGDILFKLYELGMANGDILPFTAQDFDKDLLATDISWIKPTLSPKDPNFPAWWEEHKAEWETGK